RKNVRCRPTGLAFNRLLDTSGPEPYRADMVQSKPMLCGLLLALSVCLASEFLVAPFIADAQPVKAARVGYLSGNPSADTKDALAAFRAKLRSLGHLEGQNVAFDPRYAEGHYDRLPKLAADLVRLNVNVIFVYSTPG